MRRTATVSPLRSGEITLATMHLAWNGNRILSSKWAAQTFASQKVCGLSEPRTAVRQAHGPERSRRAEFEKHERCATHSTNLAPSVRFPAAWPGVAQTAAFAVCGSCPVTAFPGIAR